jgi:hypothetical protein
MELVDFLVDRLVGQFFLTDLSGHFRDQDHFL